MLASMILIYIKLFWYHIAIYVKPSIAFYYYAKLGKLHFDLENYRSSISYIDKSEGNNYSKNKSYKIFNYFYLGYAYLNLGDIINSINAFEEYLKYKPDDPEVLQIIGWCYELTNVPEKALPYYMACFDTNDDSIILRISCSLILIELGREAEAREQLDIALNKTINSREQKILEAIKIRLAGETKLAFDNLMNIHQKTSIDNSSCEDGVSWLIKSLLIKYMTELGMKEELLAVMESSFDNSPQDLWSANSLAFEYSEQNTNLDKALGLINYALKYQPENYIFWDTKGWILFKIGRKDEASKALNYSLKLNPNFADAKKHLEQVQ